LARGCQFARLDGWRTVQNGVEVKLTRHPETAETAILCRSAVQPADRSGAGALAVRIARSKKRLDPAPLNRQIDRILQQPLASPCVGARQLSRRRSLPQRHIPNSIATAPCAWWSQSQGCCRALRPQISTKHATKFMTQ
jgi:hypothetical protein